MFSYEQSSVLKVISPHKDQWGNHVSMWCHVLNLVGDCSTTSIGRVGASVGRQDKHLPNLAKALVHVLTHQHTAQLCEAQYTWKFIQTGPNKMFTYERYINSYLTAPLDEVCNNSHSLDVVAWTGDDMQIKVWEVSKDLATTPLLANLPKDLDKYTYQVGSGTPIPLKIITEKQLKEDW